MQYDFFLIRCDTVTERYKIKACSLKEATQLAEDIRDGHEAAEPEIETTDKGDPEIEYGPEPIKQPL